MHLLPGSTLVPLVLLACSTSAGLVPKSPRTSLDGNEDLERRIQSRQARKEDVIRWRREGPKRKRQDPSQPVCVPSPVGQNLVINGGFETSNTAPFLTSSTGGDVSFRAANGYGYQSAYALVFSASASGGTKSAEQTVQVCAGSTVDITLDIGKANVQGVQSCQVLTSITTGGTTTTLYSGIPCVTEICKWVNNSGDAYSRQQTSLGPFASSGPATFRYEVNCPSGSGRSLTYVVDNILIARTA